MDLSIEERKKLFRKRIVCIKGFIGAIAVDCSKNPDEYNVIFEKNMNLELSDKQSLNSLFL